MLNYRVKLNVNNCSNPSFDLYSSPLRLLWCWHDGYFAISVGESGVSDARQRHWGDVQRENCGTKEGRRWRGWVPSHLESSKNVSFRVCQRREKMLNLFHYFYYLFQFLLFIFFKNFIPESLTNGSSDHKTPISHPSNLSSTFRSRKWRHHNATLYRIT